MLVAQMKLPYMEKIWTDVDIVWNLIEKGRYPGKWFPQYSKHYPLPLPKVFFSILSTQLINVEPTNINELECKTGQLLLEHFSKFHTHHY